MKLSELTYQVVKNVTYLEDAGFTYDAFINQDYDNDQDYANAINNAMAPINEAIHRLSDRDKIMFQIVGVGVPASNLIDISAFSKNVKKIKAVFYMTSSDYVAVGFREYSKNFLFVENVYKAPLFVQYVQDIKPFSLADIYSEEDNVELSSIGITDTMCSYIIEYAQGKLQEPIAPELANMHITRAEQYFDDLEEQQVAFKQKVITKKFTIL